MLSTENLNTKALQELLWYFLGERITVKNDEVKHLIATNVTEWFIFDAQLFDKLFARDKALVKKYEAFRDKQPKKKRDKGIMVPCLKIQFAYNRINSLLICKIGRLKTDVFIMPNTRECQTLIKKSL